MKHTYYPLALIFFALCAHRAEAMALDGIARCALDDSSRFESPASAEEDTTCIGADQDDLAIGAEEDLSPTIREEGTGLSACAAPADLVTIAVDPARPALRLSAALGRALTALHDAIVVPLRHGCAVFGAGNEPPPAPKQKKKPRMLTLF
jgi:hypothetical protein